MAINLSNNDIVRLRVGCYWSGQAGLNNYHVTIKNVVGAPTLEGLATWFDARIHAAYKGVMTNTASYYGVLAQRISPIPKSVGVVSAANIGVGTDGPDGLPGQVSGIISFSTDFSGHSQRGRVYIPFPDESANDANTNGPDAGYVLGLQNIANLTNGTIAYVEGANTADVEFGVYHRLVDECTKITSGRAKEAWATQRSRGSFGSKNPYPPF